MPISTISQDDFNGLMCATPVEFQNNEFYNLCLYAQMMHESSNPNNPNGMSLLYTDYNNLFGMKPSSIRTKYWSSQVSLSGEIFATYEDNDGQMSVIDRVDLDKHFNTQPPVSADDIPRYMADVYARGYATDPNYLQKWYSWIRQLAPFAVPLTPYKPPIAPTSSSNGGLFSNLRAILSSISFILMLVVGIYLYNKLKKK